MSTRNTRFNATGNVDDELGGSYYILDTEGERVAGPFGSKSYAVTVRDRSNWPRQLHIEYEPDGPVGAD